MIRAGYSRRLAASVSRRSRERKLDLFLTTVAPTQTTAVLDVGVEDGGQGDPAVFTTGNFIEHGWPAGRLYAVGLHDGSQFTAAFPSVEYVQADARAMPFPDGSFDAVLCNAVVEHVGDEVEQRALVQECCRVGRQVIVTTPNRSFPIEVHTLMPLVHWLPERVYRPFLMRRAAHRVGDLRLLRGHELVALFPSSHDARLVRRGMTLVALGIQRPVPPGERNGTAS